MGILMPHWWKWRQVQPLAEREFSMGSSIFTCLVSRGTKWSFVLDDPSRNVCRVTSKRHSMSLSGAKGRFAYNLFSKAKLSLKGRWQICLWSTVKNLDTCSVFLSCYANPLHAQFSPGHLRARGTNTNVKLTRVAVRNKIHCI